MRTMQTMIKAFLQEMGTSPESLMRCVLSSGVQASGLPLNLLH